MNLSENEQSTFDLLKKKTEVTLDEIVSIEGCSRHAMIVRLKYLAAKVAPAGWIIENVAGVGRGKKAKYRMEKKF